MRQKCQHRNSKTGEVCGKPAVDFETIISVDMGLEEIESSIIRSKYWLCAEHWDQYVKAVSAFKDFLTNAAVDEQ